MIRRLVTAAVCAALAVACATGSGGEAGFVGKLAAGQRDRAVSGVASPDATADTVAGAAAAAAAGAAGGNGPGAAAAAAAAGAGAAGGTAEGFHPRKVGKLGPGVSDTEIRIGFQVAGNLGAGFALVGASGSPPEERRIVETFVAWINKTGGLAGRKVVPIIHETDPTGGTWATQAAAASATFTEDNQVLAVGTSVVGGTDELFKCLSAKGVPAIEQNLWLFDHTYYQGKAGSLLYQPGRISPDRWAKSYVDGLAQAGYFEGKPKVGLVRFDAPVFERISNNVLKPEMQAHGMRFTDEIPISSPESIAAFSSVSSQVSNAILRLRNDHVTHVMFLENAGILPFLFMPAAESQGYRPRYGLSSSDIPATQESQVPPVQLKGSVGVGWLAGSDVGNDAHPAGNPAAEECFALTQANFGGTTGFYRLPPCDTLLFLRRVLDIATDLTPEGIHAAAETLGMSYNSPVVFATRFGPGRYDGGDQYRLLFFEDGCTCYRFTGPNYPVPG